MYKHPKREEKKKWMCIAQKIFFGLCWLCFIFHENTQGHLRPAVCSWEGENKLPKCFFIWNSQIARLPSPLFLAFGSTFACHPAPFPASYIVTDSPQMFLVRRGKKTKQPLSLLFRWLKEHWVNCTDNFKTTQYISSHNITQVKVELLCSILQGLIAVLIKLAYFLV